ncbi:hypothetical protein [Sphingobacterium gobiense]|uniref:asparagine synthase (glutamine-hydrolyzing) n=1 Tax=Sphingobacterium gobiense TaxID=1382456 RepID=A0A2S9JLE0_9SPHI|nr:hypothetical protein [Sphingobacterium gobiense]PRD53941.1 hypothetical protein C5749_10545 [Sphingobacterium gobiense]
MIETIKGNWVGCGAVFYHEKTGAVGPSIEDVVDYANLEIDTHGLAAYLDYGYAVFGRTPVKHVKFLLPNETLRVVDGKILVEEYEDRIVDNLGKQTNEEDVLDLMEERVNTWASSFQEDILIPTSGGFDSRLLNVLLKERNRIHAYTYGTSYNQDLSREVVYAKALSERLGTHWRRIDLGKFNTYISEWYALYGVSIAASGTYHMEFFDQIANIENNTKLHLLSGIIGDAWAGAVAIPEINTLESYRKLGHTHGMSADAAAAMGVGYKEALVAPRFEKQKELLKVPEYRILATMRTKMMMLQFLITLPKHYGFEAYSPFLDQDIAIAMLNLAPERRANRQWQRDFFKKHNLLFEDEKHQYTYQNSLNYDALLNHPLEPLNVSVLREVIRPAYLEWINTTLARMNWRERVFQTLMHTPKVKEGLKLLGFKNKLLQAYFAYITIKPVEMLLLKRNAS